MTHSPKITPEEIARMRREYQKGIIGACNLSTYIDKYIPRLLLALEESQAENKVMREALEKVSNHTGDGSWLTKYCHLRDIASEALEAVRGMEGEKG